MGLVAMCERVLGAVQYERVVRMVIEAASAQASAMLSAAGVSRSHVGLLRDATKAVASGAAVGAKVSLVLEAMGKLPGLASDRGKLSSAVLKVAEEVLGADV